MNQVEISPVRDAEVEAVVALWRRTGLVRPWNDPHRDLELARRHSSSEVLVARREDEVLGVVLVGLDGHRGWIYYLAVDPDQQRRGLGRTLVTEAETWLVDRGAPKVQLMVRSENTLVVDFYRALGYQAQDCLVLGRRLDGREAPGATPDPAVSGPH